MPVWPLRRGVGVGVGSAGQVRERLVALFDLVHGGVGAAQDPVGSFAGQVGGAGDTDRHAQLQQPLVFDGLLQLGAQDREGGRGRQNSADGDFVTAQRAARACRPEVQWARRQPGVWITVSPAAFP